MARKFEFNFSVTRRSLYQGNVDLRKTFRFIAHKDAESASEGSKSADWDSICLFLFAVLNVHCWWIHYVEAFFTDGIRLERIKIPMKSRERAVPGAQGMSTTTVEAVMLSCCSSDGSNSHYYLHMCEGIREEAISDKSTRLPRKASTHFVVS